MPFLTPPFVQVIPRRTFPSETDAGQRQFRMVSRPASMAPGAHQRIILTGIGRGPAWRSLAGGQYDGAVQASVY
jgi:hypothetical protein